MSTYTLSIVIPLYNKGPHIGRALRSVLAQSIQDFEIIVVDDGSTDRGTEVVRSIKDPRIRLIQQPNAGVSVARNRGIDESQSEMIAFLDADDQWKPHFLETILRLRKQFPDAGLYVTAYELCEPAGEHRVARYAGLPPAPWEGVIPNYFRSATFGDPPACASAAVVPRNVLKAVGSFVAGERFGEDLDLWGRIALKYPVAFSWQVGAIYFRNADNRACKSYIMEQELPFVRRMSREIKEGLIPQKDIADISEYMVKLQMFVVIQNVLYGDKRLARKILRECNTVEFKSKKVFWSFLSKLPRPIALFALHTKDMIGRLVDRKVRSGI